MDDVSLLAHASVIDGHFSSHFFSILIGRPIEPGEVSMYFYGITACDLSHVRAAVNFVVLFRKRWCSYFGVLLKDFAGGLPLELPNAVICQVDALEAELIATKKICAKYPYMDQCHGLFSTYGPQISHDWCGSNGSVPVHLAQQYDGSAAHNTYTNIKKASKPPKESSKIFVDGRNYRGAYLLEI